MTNSISQNVKSNLSTIIILLLVLVGLGGYWFYTATLGSIIIDNPSDKSIVVTVDNTDYTLAPNTYQKIDLGFGSAEYTVLVDQKEVGSFKKGMFDGDSVINPTLTTYIKESIVYGGDDGLQKAEDAGAVKEEEVCLQGKSYRGYNIVAYSGLYIAKDWDYGFDKPSPTTVMISADADYSIQDEVFSQTKFIEQFDSISASDLEDC